MRKRERRNGLMNLLVLVVTCILFLMIFAHQLTTRALFLPGPSTYGEEDSIRFVEVEDGTRLAVYWGPAPGAEWTVLYLHGNAEDLGHAQRILTNYRLRGINALSFDYRGYGLSEGLPTEKNVKSDCEAIYRYAIDTLGAREDRLIVHGRSLGGGAAMHLAARRRPAALILESTFLSVYRLAFPVSWLPGDKFDNVALAKKVACPTLVIHARHDEVVPFEQGERLAALIPERLRQTLWLEDAGHNARGARGDARYWAAIGAFVSSLPTQ